MSADAEALDRDVPREEPDVRVVPAAAFRAPDRDERVPAERAFPAFEVALALAPFFDRDADADVRERADVPDRADEEPPDAREAGVRVPVRTLEAMPTD
ncbi:hypothetical protein EF294_00095 [Gordonia oryzae]|uniref:Uncharacterized protein n=2 Tax=Gordonia oryzae TaxID=2487349 RepID=A0A3N4H5D8_9ACTN|nr:hypothetical protein EF294_00095 [Gordonia oryzae]